MPATIVIVYHSGYGKTKLAAEHVLKGVQSVPGVSASLITSEDAVKNMDALHAADGIIFGCPTYMGSISAKFKEFIEATSKHWMALKWKDKIAAGFTNSGAPSGDKLNTLEGLMINAMQHGMVWVGNAFIPDASAGPDKEVNRLSSFVGLMTQAPYGAPQPVASDLFSAEIFGKRVAEATVRWVRGRG